MRPLGEGRRFVGKGFLTEQQDLGLLVRALAWCCGPSTRTIDFHPRNCGKGRSQSTRRISPEGSVCESSMNKESNQFHRAQWQLGDQALQIVFGIALTDGSQSEMVNAGANSGELSNGSARESGTLPQLPQRIPEVLKQHVHLISSLVPQRHYRIDLRRTPRGDVSGQGSCGD
jgi:hypothetical protein